VIRRRRRPAHA